MKKDAGFTLLELLIVITIIGILNAIGIPSLLGLYNPLKNAAASVQTSFNKMQSLGRLDSSRMYCIKPKYPNINDYPDREVNNFVGFSTVPTDFGNYLFPTNQWRQEPELDIELPKGITLSRVQINNSSGDLLLRAVCSKPKGMNAFMFQQRNYAVVNSISFNNDSELGSFSTGYQAGYGIILAKSDSPENAKMEASISGLGVAQSIIGYRRVNYTTYNFAPYAINTSSITLIP